jgi:hypothetical protein
LSYPIPGTPLFERVSKEMLSEELREPSNLKLVKHKLLFNSNLSQAKLEFVIVKVYKSIRSTETYIHNKEMMYNGEENDKFTVKVADTMDKAVKLMEVGFEFHAEIEGHKLFRKKK